MDMTSKDDINFIVTEPALEHHSHALSLHEMSIITVVDWSMHQDNKPWSLLPVNPCKLFSKPLPLRGIFYCNNAWKYKNIQM